MNIQKFLHLIFLLLIISTFLLFNITHILAAEVHIYPNESIQLTIEGSNDGDIIILHQGTYVENINFLGKAITLRSNNPNDPNVVAATIIDGNQTDSVIIFNHKEESNCILSGITLQNGKSCFGGAVYCSFSSPTIHNCIITKNSTSNDGAGICCDYSSAPIIRNCIITGNFALNSTGNACGGGIYCSYTSPTIINCTVSKNAADMGGGIYCSSSSPYIVNSIFWDNGSEIYVMQGSNPKLSYCDIQGGYPGLGNINANPLFIDPETDNYSLQINSPCLDTGNPRISDRASSPSDIGAYGGNGEIESVPINIVVSTDGSGNFSSIQDAIDYAINGDTITVFPGTYSENLVIGAKNISLISQGGYQSTIINGSGSGSVIVLTNVGAAAIFDGFTIQNGSAEYGGGIWCQFSSPSIRDCILHNNSASWGGGIYCSFSSPTINSCTITENLANTGGGIGCQYSSPQFSNCILHNNSASWGGGIYCSFSSPDIMNCTFNKNSTDLGGGIYCSSSSPTITNSILWGDLPNEVFLYNSIPLITFSNIQKGYEGEGNIDEDPLFYDPNRGEYHLQTGSPCIDAGINNGAPDKDIEGKPRPFAEKVDLGAHEFAYDSLMTFFQDIDADGYGNPNVKSTAIDAPEGFVENPDDCDDTNNHTHPNAEEICDNEDNNCDGWIDVTIKKTSGLTIENLQEGRNIIFLNTACHSYSSFDFLSNFKNLDRFVSIHHKDQFSEAFQSNYSFFGKISGEKITLPYSSSITSEDSTYIYIIDLNCAGSL